MVDVASRVAHIARHRSGSKSCLVSADGALQQGATRKSRLNILDFIVVSVLLRIGTPIFVLVLVPSLSRFVIADVSFLAGIQAMVRRSMVMRVGETTLPPFPKTLFHDSFEYFHFASNFFDLAPE